MSSPPIRARSPEEGAEQVSWWSAALTLGVLGTCLFSGLGALGLVGPDEPRYMAIARAMLQSGDWVTPRLYGQPWFEKPALCYWAAAAAFRVFGVSEFAARLPSALAALLAAVAIAWAALRSYGLQAGWTSLLLMPTSVALIGFARAATPDMLFTAFLATAAVSAAEMLEKRQSGQVARIMFGASLGAAALAKGPAAVLLAGGSIFLWALVSRKFRAAFRMAHPLCIAAFLVVALPWYALCAMRNPDFLHVFIVEQNFSRYVTTVFSHAQPFWYFGPVILGAMLPWTAWILPLGIEAVTQVRGNEEWRDSPGLFFGCWAVFPVLFFSFSQSKLPGYVLPAIPPLVFLLARIIAQRVQTTTAGARWYIALVGCTIPALAVATFFRIPGLPIGSNLAVSKALFALRVAAIVGGLACSLVAFAGGLRVSLITAAALVAVLLAGSNLTVIPRFDPLLSARAAARATPTEALDRGSVAVLGLSRSWVYGLDFYCDRRLPEWTPTTAAPAWVWTTELQAAELDRHAKIDVLNRISSEAWLVRIDGEKQPDQSGAQSSALSPAAGSLTAAN